MTVLVGQVKVFLDCWLVTFVNFSSYQHVRVFRVAGGVPNSRNRVGNILIGGQ